MVLKKIRDAFSGNDEKYEVLYYKYSKIKLENQELKKKHMEDMKDYKLDVQRKAVEHIIRIYEDIETAKMSSYKVTAVDKDLQRLLMDVNKVEKTVKELMKDFSLEEVMPSERFFDPEIHEVASYESAKGMQKGLIIKTVKKGFRYRGEIIKKPQVVVTK